MSRFTQLALATFACAILCSCSKEEPNPELRDPIYADLQRREAAHTKANEEALKEIISLKANLAKAETGTLIKRDIERDLAKNHHIVLESGQWARYYKIRAERRRLVDKLSYKEAFHAKKPWPDPSEYSDYLVNRRLVEVSRNWNARVPKLQSRLTSPKKVSQKPEKAEQAQAAPEH